MSATCEFEMRTRYACKESPVIGFAFCMEHLQSPRGLVHAQEVIANGGMPTISDLEKEIKNRTSIPDVDYHTSALEKMDATLTEIMSWTEGARKRLETIDEDEWRYQDRARQEQVRAEVLIYERALDREAKVLKDVSKMALQEKIVSLGRAQTELMIRLMMRVLENLHLDDVKFQQARMDLLMAFQEEANLASSVEREVTKELTAPIRPDDIQDAEVVEEYAS